MSDRLLLDTHIWFRLQVTPEKLKANVVGQIEAAARHGNVFVSIISIWELAMLEHKQRLDLGGNAESWCQRALDRPGISLVPLTPRIVVDSVNLPAPMHKDPFDRILVASARAKQLTLVTVDKLILRFAKHIALPCLRA